ncbi:unnamed protein product [Cochlearia groenlandica]
MDNSDEINNLDKAKAQVSEVKSAMLENIDKILQRSVVIGDLVDKTGNLHSEAQIFRIQGGQISRKMWFKNMKIKLIVFAVIIALIFIIFLSVCGGFKCA